MTDERKDLLTMSGEELFGQIIPGWSTPGTFTSGACEKLAALRDAIVRAARQSDEAGIKLVEAVRRRISYYGDDDRVTLMFKHRADACAFEAAMRATDPLPPRECVEDAKPPVLTWHEVGWYKRDLADETGRVVAHVDDCHGYLVGTGSIGRYITREQAADAVMKAALKSFAAGVGR